MTAPIDDTDFQTVLSEIGVTGTFKVKTTTKDSDWGSPTAVTNDSTSSITFAMKTLTSKHELVRQGVAKVGDAKGWFKKEDSISEGEELVVGSDTYRITNLKPSSITAAIFDTAILVKIA